MNQKSPIIKAEKLNEILDKEDVKIFDVRGIWGANPSSLYEEYKQSHIKNAYFLDWRKEFIEQNKDVNLAQVSSLANGKQSFKNLGINKNDTVILYDEYHNMFAGRIWWAMRYFGFKNVYVLDGGFRYWKAQNLPVSKELPKSMEGSYTPTIEKNLRISMESFIDKKDTSYVLDARGEANYKGKVEDKRSGHIPKAINIPFGSMLDSNTGLFLEKEQLKEIFDKNIKEDKDIIVSCGSGYASTVVMLVLEHLGIESTLFDESFAIWKEDLNKEIEQG